MVYFVGAGSGAVDLITVRGQRLLRQADVVIYAGSLVNPQLLQETRPDCRLYNSAKMTLEEVLEVIGQAEREGATIVRLHTGDPCLYGAIREQMDQLDDLGIAYEYVPGVSSFCAAAAALNAEYTLPDVSQTVIITRMAGRTPVPEKEEIAKLAAHQATMVIFLSTGLLEGLQERLMAGGYSADTPAAIVYKAGKACGISQKVLLTVLQKEQHLLTATNPNDFQFKAAMGLSCPDDANCDPTYAGFFKQVYGAAKRYQYYLRHEGRYGYHAGRLNYIQYNPNASCGGSNVYIENRATALLYIYTPYQPNAAALEAGAGEGDSCSSYGNRNFAIIYHSMFGSPRG